MQLADGHRLNLLLPLLGYVDYLLAQVEQRMVVELLSAGRARQKNSAKRRTMVVSRRGKRSGSEVEELQQQVGLYSYASSWGH